MMMQLSPPCVLLVDDDTALLQALPQALSLRIPGMRVETADSAAEALQRIQQYDYDAIISDIKMPGMDGLALLARIKELRPDTPTLLITGHGEHDLAIQALRGAAYDFIQKPIDREYFVAALQRAMQTHHLHRQVQEQQRTLEQYTHSLEALVQERTRELAEANAAKDRFLSMASHELKTPLASLKGMTQVLRRRLEHTGSPEVSSVAIMERSIRRMEVLVRDILSTTLLAMEVFALHRRSCDLVELCQHVVDEHRMGIDPAPTLLVHMPDEVVEAVVDADRISQVLLNLLSNASRYSPRGAPVTLSLERTGSDCLIAVHDQGVGIPADQQAHIFERFYQVPGMKVQTGSSVGLGLGLYISQQIVERHGGRIEVQSLPGKGSTFSIILPLAADVSADMQENTTAAPFSKQADSRV